jgi:hypothetical protein
MVAPLKLVKVLVIGCAGVSAFYVSARWSRDQHEGVLLPIERNVKAVPSSLPAAPAPDQVRALPAVSAASAATASGSSPADAAAKAEAAIELPAFIAERSRAIPRSDGDPFVSLSWLPAPPPAPAPPPQQAAVSAAPAPPPPAPAPVAPPLPFAFLGMIESGTPKPAAFLSRGEALFVVSVGDKVDNNTYQVNAITANEVVLTYLPLNIRQTLPVPAGTP